MVTIRREMAIFPPTCVYPRVNNVRGVYRKYILYQTHSASLTKMSACGDSVAICVSLCNNYLPRGREQKERLTGLLEARVGVVMSDVVFVLFNVLCLTSPLSPPVKRMDLQG